MKLYNNMCYCGKLCYDIPRLTFVIVSEITSKDCNICTGSMHTPVYTIVVIGYITLKLKQLLDQDVPSVVLQLPVAIKLNLIKRTYTVDKQTIPDNTDFYEKYEDVF